jgi:hypothetical protein
LDLSHKEAESQKPNNARPGRLHGKQEAEKKECGKNEILSQIEKAENMIEHPKEKKANLQSGSHWR